MLFLVVTENRIPRHVNASVGIRATPKLSRISAEARPGARSEPERPIKGSVPTTAMPATVLHTASRATIAVEYVKAANVFPQKTSPREHERVSTVFHVACRSSLAKMSPATTLASSGNPAIPANPSTTSGIANPDEWTHRPKSESAGTDDCVLMKSAKANGPTRQAAAAARGSHWEVIFAISTR